jgi:uncharacterized membrane protein
MKKVTDGKILLLLFLVTVRKLVYSVRKLLTVFNVNIFSVSGL